LTHVASIARVAATLEQRMVSTSMQTFRGYESIRASLQAVILLAQRCC
jgi:hypothetical protein